MRIAIALFDGVEELDFVGPWEVLAHWAQQVSDEPVELRTAAPTTEPVHAAKGLRVVPDSTLDDIGEVDVFLMPGGRGTRALLSPDEPLHVALRAMAERGTLMTSVCTGALVYAAAGLLRNRPATTYWACFDELLALDPTIEARPDERFVDDGDVITSAGVSAGIDMSLHLVRRLAGDDAARRTRRGIQYDPQPPV
jgi:transcriptional regulator GlxA family with amidase domain